MEGKTYVLSDIHGNFEVFKRMLEKIKFSDNDRLYILGDICDRGPESLAIYFYIQKFKNITLLKGNHEYMMQEALKSAVKHNDFDYPSMEFKLWSQNGGEKTIENVRHYLHKNGLNHLDYTIVRSAFLKNLYTYLEKLPLYLELTVNNIDYVLVHAGIDPEATLPEQEEDTLLWIRDYFFLSECDLKKTYIFGHTPLCFINRDGGFDVWYDDEFHNKIGIDGGLAVGMRGQLNCLCLDDNQIFVVKMTEVYDNEGRLL